MDDQNGQNRENVKQLPVIPSCSGCGKNIFKT
jgi:hypothetical protein